MLKKPALKADYKITELIALCSAALQPSQEMWLRFLRHLSSLKDSNRLSSDEVTAVLVSSLSDSMLREVESQVPEDVDACTLDEIVDRVKTTYAGEAAERVLAIQEASRGELQTVKAVASQEIESIKSSYEAKLASLSGEKAAQSELMASSMTFEKKRRNIYETRANSFARRFRLGIQVLANLVLVLGAWNILKEHSIEFTWVGLVAFSSIAVFVIIEFIGLRSHISGWLRPSEKWIASKIFNWLYPDISN